MRTFRRLLALHRPQAGWLALGLLLGLATLLANTVLMATSGWFITAMALAGAAGVTMNYFTPAAIIRACAIVRTAGRYGERLVTHDATLRLLTGLRTRLYRTLVPLAPAGLEDLGAGTLLSRLVADVDILDRFYLRILLPGALFLLATLLLLAWTAWQALLLVPVLGGTLLLAGVVLPALLARRAGPARARAEAELEALRTEAADAWLGLDELLVHGADELWAERLERRGRVLARHQLAASRWHRAGEALVGLCAWSALWGVLVLAGPETAGGALPPAELALLAFLALAAFEAALPMPGAFQALAPTLAAADRLFALADRPPPLEEPPEPAPTPLHHGFRLEAVTLRLPGNPEPALDGVCCELPPGRHTAIVGPTGSGKSSLLQLLVRFRLPDEGRVEFGGHPMESWPGEALRRHLAVVEQQPHLFIGTLRDNLLLARPDAGDPDLLEALEAACLGDWVNGLPYGLETEVGEAAMQLSGGEARRLAVARALLRDAPVLLLDEPTEGLDRPTARALMANLRLRYRDRTLVVVTHHTELLPAMDQVILLDRGRVLARGTHEELRAESAPYRRLLALAPVLE